MQLALILSVLIFDNRLNFSRHRSRCNYKINQSKLAYLNLNLAFSAEKLH